ncbi:MAG: hypothetical protein CMB34_03665 [Euryarchaeota archaeon]|nr:hypothetical protein [Euryarchaeota archaeon]
MTAISEQQERTVVDNEQMSKGDLRRAVEFLHQVPKACARDLLSLQTHAHDGSLRVGVDGRREFFRLDTQEVPGHVRGTKRHAGLGHAPRAWIHPQQQRGRPQPSPLLNELFMMWPGVIQRIGGVRNRARCFQFRNGLIARNGETFCGLFESLDVGHVSP